ncbi:TonB-dependent receptor [Ideonella sp. DXS29W]|uniref:TonB-dependent receptor n=1 Tax=Ideonella lacteola TaxID=2984193 RepID=A0ABU9BPD7_9BURK
MNNEFLTVRPRAVAVAAACALVSNTMWAQSASMTAGAASQTVVVTGNPLGNEDLTAPASTLSGDKLTLRRGGSLGETLDGLPGVSATYFGPNANRPVIRGQDGDRIRVLSNAGASLDASSLSFDHAVPIDPLVVERIEVLRGPAALLYGGSAVGGVVNAIDNRIPSDAIQGVKGAVEGRLGGAANERGVSGLVETGGDGFALHADAFWRKTDDLRVPEFDRPLDDGTTERRDRVSDSAGEAKGGAVGGSAVWQHGHLGASVDTYRNNYGAVAEEGIVIHMKRDKFALAGEVRDLGTFITTVRGQLGYTDYQHQEVEATGEIGTTFKNKGTDFRLEAIHAKQAFGGGELEGVWGLQGESSKFEALGEEGFVPTTQSRQLALFAVEQWAVSRSTRLSAGLRYENAQVDSDGDPADAVEPKFGPARERSFSPLNASLGLVHQWSPQWQLSANGSFTERAPVSYELYANGVHAATGTFERGDVDLAKERGRHLDLGLQWKRGEDRAKISAFYSRFSNYIVLQATGEPDVVDGDESFPVYAFRGVPAQLYGLELEGQVRLLDAASKLDLDGHADWVRGTDRATGEPLPRLAPVRMTVGLNWQMGDWSARAEVQHAEKQTRVPDDDTATPSWTIVNLAASYRIRLGERDGLLFAKVNNLTNELAYNASTIATVRPLSPLPGRALMAGLRVSF